ncbi:OsmC family peroxiredoxin, partial [Streptomyces sp. NPDC127077]
MTDDTLRRVTVERTGTGHFTATNARGGTIDFGGGGGAGGGGGGTPGVGRLGAPGGGTAARGAG